MEIERALSKRRSLALGVTSRVSLGSPRVFGPSQVPVCTLPEMPFRSQRRFGLQRAMRRLADTEAFRRDRSHRGCSVLVTDKIGDVVQTRGANIKVLRWFPLVSGRDRPSVAHYTHTRSIWPRGCDNGIVPRQNVVGFIELADFEYAARSGSLKRASSGPPSSLRRDLH